MKRLILGSQSPRRKEILNGFSLPFLQVASSFDEDSIPFEGDPRAYVETLCQKKGELLQKQFLDDVILTADTVVFHQGSVLNKPQDHQQAIAMFRSLSGQWHEVFTGLCVYNNGQYTTGYERTRILFNPLTEQQIHDYHTHCPSLDKAGGYTIQGVGGLLVSKIEGCYYNVMGLPLNALRSLLLPAGIDLWHYL